MEFNFNCKNYAQFVNEFKSFMILLDNKDSWLTKLKESIIKTKSKEKIRNLANYLENVQKNPTWEEHKIELTCAIFGLNKSKIHEDISNFKLETDEKISDGIERFNYLIQLSEIDNESAMDYFYRFLPSKISKTIKTQNIDVVDFNMLIHRPKLTEEIQNN
jgi:hypothetical protein